MPRKGPKKGLGPVITRQWHQKKKTKTGVKDIDYEKLAAEILRQQNQAKTLTNEPVNVFPTAVITDSDAVQRREESGLSVDPPSQRIAPDAGQRREDSGLLLDPPIQGISVENLEASVFEGTCNEVQSQKPSNYLSILDGIPLGALVPTKVKNKIWANDYVDLRSLLPNHEQDPFTLTVTSGSINVQHNAKAKTPLSVHQWTDAFLIFTCIYLEKFS